jgi:O-antigen/teichoic acid export membrane protein
MSAGNDSLTRKVAGGVAWTLATQAVTQLSRIAVGVVLARLLTPHEFGLAGMAIVFANLLSQFNDFGLAAAIVQRPVLTEADRSTVFWINLATGVLCTLVGVAVSGAVASFFGQPQVAGLLAVLSISFILNALSATQSAIATRDLAYRRLQLREMVAVVVGATVGVIAAASGLGAWSLVLQSLGAAGAAAVMIWSLSSWRPRFLFSGESMRTLGGFGAKLFGSRLLSYANMNGDNLLIGRFLGGGALGIYSLAYGVMFTPMVRLGLPFQQVVYPVYSRLQHNLDRLGSAWVRSKQLSAAVLAPAFLGFLVVAPDLVPVVFGAKWHDAVPVLQLLCVAGVAHSLVTLNWSVLQARGMAGLLLRLNVLTTVVTVGAFVIGLNWGVDGVAGGYALARWILVLPDTWITARTVDMSPITALRTSGIAVPLAALAAVLALAVRLALVSAGIAPAWRLLLVLLIGGVAYVTLIAVFAPALIREVRGLRGMAGSERPQPAAKGAA